LKLSSFLARKRKRKLFEQKLIFRLFFQGAVSKKKEFEKLCNEGKIGQSEAQEIATRTDTLSYALLAEISTFHQQRVKDMKTAHQHFLQEQITFYQKVRFFALPFFMRFFQCFLFYRLPKSSKIL